MIYYSYNVLHCTIQCDAILYYSIVYIVYYTITFYTILPPVDWQVAAATENHGIGHSPGGSQGYCLKDTVKGP